MVEQLGLALATLIAQYERDGRYDEFIADFRDGRVSLALSRHGWAVLKDAPVPPPSGN
ncbi:MAG TPA: hypothetical protein VKE97_03360 [Acidimicrobiia bacterium]|nr:hypothetical protein [Acidimicrobiia bacterium]